MLKVNNKIWHFLASVKLALLTLILLAFTSVAGTLIQQKKAPEYYVETFGPGLAYFLEKLDLTHMYSSWWFVSLLCLFAINLIVCSIERLPRVWHTVRQDNLAIDPGKLATMQSSHRTEIGMALEDAADQAYKRMINTGWKSPRRKSLPDGSILLFAHHGAWARLGVYVVHLSILVILAGALAGTFFGFKAYVFLPEGRTTQAVFLQGSRQPVPLDFKLQSNHFEKIFYPNGMIRGYRLELSVQDPTLQSDFSKTIVVNDPLSYRGITFYLADTYPLEEYIVDIREPLTGHQQSFRVASGQDVNWTEGGLTFRVEELRIDEDGAVRQAKIQLSLADDQEPPLAYWINDKDTRGIVLQGGKEFALSFRQLYSTLLLATKDPGVPILFTGCILMVAGLLVCFCMSHRRLWIHLTPLREQSSAVLICGSSNKNNSAYELRFKKLITAIDG